MKFKKVMALLLAIVLVLGILPFSAFALNADSESRGAVSEGIAEATIVESVAEDPVTAEGSDAEIEYAEPDAEEAEPSEPAEDEAASTVIASEETEPVDAVEDIDAAAESGADDPEAALAEETDGDAVKAEVDEALVKAIAALRSPIVQEATYTYWGYKNTSDAVGYTVYTNIPYTFAGETHYYKAEACSLHKIDGKYVYCIQPDIATDWGSEYDVDVSTQTVWYQLTTTQREAITLAISYGFPTQQSLTGNNLADYTATQVIVWEIIMGMRSSTYASHYSLVMDSGCGSFKYVNKSGIASEAGEYYSVLFEVAAGIYPSQNWGDCTHHHTSSNSDQQAFINAYNKIVASMAAHKQIPSFAAGSEADISDGNTLVLEYDGSKYVGSLTADEEIPDSYKKFEAPGITFTYSGKTITATATEYSDQEYVCYATGSDYSDTAKAEVWAGGDTQTTVHVQPDPAEAWIKVKFAAIPGTAEMTKVVDSGSREGFKFKLYQNGTGKTWYGVSDANGDIMVADANYEVSDRTNKTFTGLTDGKYLLAEVDPGVYAPAEIKVSVVKAEQTEETEIGVFKVGSEDFPITYGKTNEGDDSYRTAMFDVDGLIGGGTLKLSIKNVKPEISTSAAAENGGKSISASEDAVIVDTVDAKNLVPGHKYVAVASVLVVENDKAGEVVVSNIKSEEIEATSASMKINVKIALDTSEYSGKTFVIYEELLDNTINMNVAEHKDANDKEQQVSVVSMQTTASSIGGKVALPLVNAEIEDIVHMENLIVDKEYTLKGELINKETEKSIATTEKTFKATAETMDVEMIFTVDLRGYAGKSVVVFEYLYDKTEITAEDKPIASHDELTDDKQTVNVLAPSVRTKAADAEGNKVLSVRSDVDLVDTVVYQDLVPGLKYTLYGVLMDKETGEPLLINGNKVELTEEFIPETSNGEYEMHYRFDATGFKSMDLVVFEELQYTSDGESSVLCVHKDIEDLDQTVYFPEIGTSAADEEGYKVLPAVGTIKIVDIVSYKNLIAGNEYRVVGVLYDKATGDAIKDSNGSVITAEQTFVAESENGSAEVIFEVDASLVAPYTVVVFETLYEGERELCIHADVNDEAQTVSFPEICTMLTDDTGRKNLDPKASITLIDKVSYSDLEPGVEYIMVGKIMDADTGKALVVDGEEVTAKTTFTPDAANGELDMVYSFNGSDLYGKKIVAFEYLYREKISEDEGENEGLERILMTSHEDIQDEDQTVSFTDAPRTGDENNMTIYWIILGASVVVLAGLVIALIKVRKSKKK